MFGKKKKEEIQQMPEVKIYENPRVVQVEEEPVREAPRQTIGKARIVAIEQLEGGLIRYIIVSNKKIGEIGEEFPID